MSAKTSPSSLRDAASVGPTVQIKKELPSDEIKEFAHNTMNELLGWYGYDVDRLDLTAKTSRLLQSAAAAAVATQQQQHHQQQQQQQQQLERKRHSFLRSGRTLSYRNNNYNKNNNASSSTNNSNNNNNNISGNGNGHEQIGLGRISKSGLNCNSTTTTPSDHDTRSSREDDSKSPNSIGKPATTSAMGTSQMEEKIDFNNCCWCHRPIAENAPDYLTSTDGPRYCSESCFTQSRRATFKKAKTCDWCKHVRHAVSYVDFQDGASQLQFCSEKCLNQYKMQIFCNETQAHLDMNPHLRDQGLDAGNEAALITPDLWLRNCRSRSASPASTVSVSPGPIKRSSPCATPPTNPTKPLISVAPVSKLLALRSPSIQQAAQAPQPPPPPQTSLHQQRQPHPNLASKSGRRKRLHRGGISSGSETVASLLQKQQQQQHHQPSPLSADFAGSSVPLPPLSPMPMPEQSAPPPPPVAPPTPTQSLGRGGATTIPPSYFATPPNGVLGHPFAVRPAHHFLPPPPGMLPRGFIPPFGPPPPFPTPQMPEFGLLGTAPPVTVMVPYPIIIPLPIPIPVPLPIVDFYKAHLTPEERKRFDEERSQKEPLDCSKTRTNQEEQEEQQQPETETERPDHEVAEEEEEELEKPIPKTSPSTAASPSPTPSSPVASSIDSTSPETHCIVRATSQSETDAETSTTAAQKLPKLKITRLQTKRTLIQTKESSSNPPATKTAEPTTATAAASAAECTAECSRPLRKRKRIIDCDFQKMALTREMDSLDHHSQSKDEDEACNIINNNNNNNSSSNNAKTKK